MNGSTLGIVKLVVATGSPHDNSCFRRGEFSERVASVWTAVVVVLAEEEAEIEVVSEVIGAAGGLLLQVLAGLDIAGSFVAVKGRTR